MALIAADDGKVSVAQAVVAAILTHLLPLAVALAFPVL